MINLCEGRIGDYIQLASGLPFFPFDPRPDDILIEDIAYSLSRIPRFNGHTRGRISLSVAQHSVMVSNHCHPIDALAGLLHDASDMAFGDIPRPLKYMPEFAAIREAERHCQSIIYKKFGLGPDKPPNVHMADNCVLSAEVRDLMTPNSQIWGKWILQYIPVTEKVKPWSADRAKEAFLHRFQELTEMRK